jgi:soluble P-type ATPase
MLKGDESGNFSPVSPAKSGLIIDGDVKDMKLVLSATGKLLVVAVNDNKLRVFDTR